MSPALDAVVLKAMAKGAANRYQSAAEMRTDLVRVLSGQRPLAPMVMTAEDRTAVMTAGRQQDLRPGRHRPAALADDYDAYDPYDDEEDERRRKRRKGWLIALIAVLALALIGVIAWLATSVFGKNEAPGDQLALPNVIGQTQQEAQQVLRDKGFTTVATESVACEPTPDGQTGPCGPDNIGKVISTDPAPNANVKKTDKITLRVGAPPGKVEVPDVKGMTLEEATKALQDAKLQVAPNSPQIEVEDDNLVGKVAEQTPAAKQSVSVGTQIALSIGKAPSTVSVPNLIGQNADTAEKNLKDLGFKVDRNDVSSDKPAGEVVDQSPKSGKQKPGATITLSVSKGDQTNLTVPSLVGRTVSQAKDARDSLRASGWEGDLRFQDVNSNPCSDPPDDTRIVAQDPDAGRQLGKRSAITLTVTITCGN
ncbi:MAG TPA: hypothetical protein DGT23_14615 [Micromonosporaceae bacterium]|nr:hypothetical protein [Micromonosporaceae bacterium]